MRFSISIISKGLIIFLFTIVIYVISKNITAPQLNHDEAVQFWVSNGLAPDSEPYSPNGNLADFIEMNKHYNMDPGGFGFLIHYWGKLSSTVIWLRLLPLLFLLGISVCLIYLTYSWFNNFNYALFSGLIPLLIPVVVNAGFEIRAYSMEGFCALLAVVSIERVRNLITIKKLIFWSLVLSFFMTSRYSVIPFVGICYMWVFVLIIKRETTLNTKVIQLVSWTLPFLISIVYVYLFALIEQNKGLEQLHYLPYLKEDFSILFSKYNLLVLIGIAMIIVFWLFVNKVKVFPKFFPLLFISVTYFLSIIILSLLGKHPFEVFSIRGLTFLLLFVFSMLCVLLFILDMLIKQHDKVKNVIIFSTAFLLVLLNIQKLQSKIGHTHNSFYELQKVNLDRGEMVFVDMRETPHVRYLLEFGGLSKHPIAKHYPESFEFTKYKYHAFYGQNEKLGDWYKKNKSMNELLEFDYIISPIMHIYGEFDKWERVEGCLIIWRKKK